MRRVFAATILVLCLFLTPAYAEKTAFDTAAKSAIVVDLNTGAILLDKNSDKRIPTASMSKVMTMYMVFDALEKGRLNLDDKLPVSEKAWKMGGSKMFVKVGDRVPVEDLIKGVIVQSGNDATIVLAEALSGSEERFASDMTAMAKEIGMTNSNFANASGWPHPDHYSTPRDLAILSWQLVKNFPEYYKYYGIQEFTWSDITQSNRNPILGSVKGVDGLKTGHTEEAGYCLIGSGVRNDRRVVMVLTGMESKKQRAEESTRVIEWAMNNFRSVVLKKAGETIIDAPVAYGLSKTVPLVLAKDASTTIPVSIQPDTIEMKTLFESPLIAPIKKGEQVGTLRVSIPDVGDVDYTLYTGTDVAEKGWVGKTFEKILHAAKNR